MKTVNEKLNCSRQVVIGSLEHRSHFHKCRASTGVNLSICTGVQPQDEMIITHKFLKVFEEITVNL